MIDLLALAVAVCRNACYNSTRDGAGSGNADANLFLVISLLGFHCEKLPLVAAVARG